MKKLALLVAAPALFAVYQYYYSDPLTSIDGSRWWQNGSLTTDSSGLSAPTTNGGSLISKVAVPDGTSQYEVAATLRLTATGGAYSLYLRATQDALAGPAASGSYYVVELQNPTFTDGICSATLAVYKRQNGVVTALTSFALGCRDGMILHAVSVANNGVLVTMDGLFLTMIWDAEGPLGQPGIGARETPSGNSISLVQLGPLDRVAPSGVNAQSVATTPFPNSVDIQFQGAADDANGVGVMGYQFWRDGQYICLKRTPVFTDDTVQPETTYNYTFAPLDAHLNEGPTTAFSVRTPPAGYPNPRRVGVRPTGAYWGGPGEQIDMLSGNLNFTLPLFKAVGRGNWGVTFALSYNSQLWRQDSAGQWKLGRDTGYGFGWKLQAGSLVPSWSGYWTLHHYTYIDSSGAEYRLDVNTNGLWTSREGIYLEYDSGTRRLYFPDGSFWVFDCESSGKEEDTGALYPTLMQDTNGNQVKTRYLQGEAAPWGDTSARIRDVEDVRSSSNPPNNYSYRLHYNTDSPIPHIISVTNQVQTGETYNFYHLKNQPLNSPFSPFPSFGTTTLLEEVSGVDNLEHNFLYEAGAGELTKVVFPYKGYLRWYYRAFTLGGNRTHREVYQRLLAPSQGAPEQSYVLYREDTGQPTLHQWAVLADPLGSDKVWYFYQGPSDWRMGLAAIYQERNWAPTLVYRRVQELTWTQDAAGNPYIASTLTKLDPGTAYEVQTKTEQTLDIYGNLTQLKGYDYNQLSTPARTYNNTYLTGTNYSSRRIRNRLTLSQVTSGGQTTTLVSNGYDGYGAQCGGLYELITLTNRTGLGQHDTANYGPTFYYRGNPTHPGRFYPAPTCMSYDIGGAVVKALDGAGRWVTQNYTSGTDYAAPSSMTVSSLTQTMQWSAFLGLTQTVGPNGDTASYGYDAYARPLSTQSPYGATATFSYTTTPPTKKATLGDRWTKTTMDGFGRPVKVESGYGTTTVSVGDTEYTPCACSPLGKVSRVSQPYALGATVYWTTYAYDGLGRTLSVTHPGNTGTTTYVYEGNTVKVIDPAGKWKKYRQDVFGNLTKVWEPNPAGGADLETNYTYSRVNQLLQVEMPRGSVTQYRTFVYSGHLLQSATHPESGTTSCTYNGDNTLATRTDAKGQRTEYSYDSLKRLTVVRYFISGIEDPNQRVDYRYDLNPYDANYSQYAQGRLVAVDYYAGGYNAREMYSYHQAGAVTKKYLSVAKYGGPVEMEGQFEYDNEGRQTATTYPLSLGRYAYSFDSMGRPNKLTKGTEDQVWGVQYNAAGQMTQISHLGATETRTYNERGQMTRLTAPGLVDLEYRYSATQNNGRITQRKDWINGEEITYQYDALQRLIAASTTGPEWGLSFGYDGFGNRTYQRVTKGSAPVRELLFDGNTNRILGGGYDANGNLLEGPYDVENRLMSYPAYGETYGYAPDNKRVLKLTGEQSAYYFYAPSGERLVTIPPDWVAVANVYFAGKLVRSNGQTVVTDRLGSVVYHATTGRASYFPYGEEKTPATSNNRDKFGTYYRDASTGLDYADQRYYEATSGRFLTPDNSGLNETPTSALSFNQYAYVHGDPINSSDPTGLTACGDLMYVPTAGSVSAMMSGNSELGWLSRVIWGEGDDGRKLKLGEGSYYDEKAGIGWSVINRMDILNNAYWVLDDSGNPVRQSQLGIGPTNTDATTKNVITSGAYKAFTGDVLIGQGRLDTILNSEADDRKLGPLFQVWDPVNRVQYLVNTMCFNVMSSAYVANQILHGQTWDPYEGMGLTVAFNLGTQPPDPALMRRFGRAGGPGTTTFYGYPWTRLRRVMELRIPPPPAPSPVPKVFQ